MNDPIKLIWKYKNNNKKIQYNVCIFVGSLLDKNIKLILNKISELSFYDTLINIHNDEYKQMEQQYGTNWYNFFFNTYHINNTIHIIKNSHTQQNELVDKYGNAWYDLHIGSKNLFEKKIVYSYESLIKSELIKKIAKKHRTLDFLKDKDEEDKNYIMSKKINLENMYKESIKEQKGKGYDEFKCMNEYVDDHDEIVDFVTKQNTNNNEFKNDDSQYEFVVGTTENLNKFHLENGNNYLQLGGGDEDSNYEQDNTDEYEEDTTFEENELSQDEVSHDEEIDLEEIEKIYKDVDVVPDKNLSETTKLIKKALNDDDIFEKKINNMVKFDDSNDEQLYDIQLKDVFNKHFVYEQYIYKDDTIKMLKQKICCGLKSNEKFDNDLYLIPSRQYLWTEYIYENEINKIMLGQKWLRRNELLSVDVEPLNNLRNYEELKNVLKNLRENIRRYSNKIRVEDDENNILYDYETYMLNNEIFMIDIYNEFGLNYNPDQDTIKNLLDVYLRIYFPKIKYDDTKTIIELLNGNKKNELSKVKPIFETINNELTIYNEITNIVDSVKKQGNYQYIFKENYITQSAINLNLEVEEGRINMFKIFDDFILTENYPFIQYQTLDGIVTYKFHEGEIDKFIKTKENKNVLSRWFEYSHYGINFKIKINDDSKIKYMSVLLRDGNKLEYKTQWKGDYLATIDDVIETYKYIIDLVKKLNEESINLRFKVPTNEDFRFAYINSIQNFALPNEYVINHNNLSNFSRLFYPYISLVIDPRKRLSKKLLQDDDKSKYGTYLRYKRISKYESYQRIEQRIIYIIRNYEYTPQLLAVEISKQFNITEENAMEEVKDILQKYPNLKKSRKVLKKMETLPKYKPQGIGVDIQGKTIDKYKIRISGARDNEQLGRICEFTNILLHLYVETYHVKNPKMQQLIKTLEKLKNIAERINKVNDVILHDKEVGTLKNMAKIDKRRIGFKPEKGQNQWSRSCQNSGQEKRRQPLQYPSDKIGDLLKLGYSLNKKTGNYEKRVMITENGKKKEQVLQTVKVNVYDDYGNLTGNEILYACDPKINGENFYVGFLSKSKNPFGDCMPCCFKKNPMTSRNKKKMEFFKKCVNPKSSKEEELDENLGDKLYILQDTNKIQEGRFGFLPKYLDIYFNFLMGNQKKIKHHYLTQTETGYYLKQGVNNEGDQFLNSIIASLDLSYSELIDKIVKCLKNDTNEQIFTSINGGDIKTKFKTRENFITVLQSEEFFDSEILIDLISVPNSVTKTGLNIVIFKKKNVILKKTLEKTKIREDFTISCKNNDDISNLKSKTRQTMFIIKEDNYYYPIMMVHKPNEMSKNIDIIKLFKYEENPSNIVNHISHFYEKNCNRTFLDSVIYKNSSLPAYAMTQLLSSLDSKYHVKHQQIDIRNKVKYLITSSNLIIPVRPSGSLYNIHIIKNIDKYINDYSTTFTELEKIYKLSDSKIPIKPIGVYYDEQSNDVINANSIIIETYDVVPIQPIKLKISKLKEHNLIYEKKTLEDKIDYEISKGRTNIVIDDRITSINKNKYLTESYELFRLEFSTYINDPSNESIKKKLETIIKNDTLAINDKYSKIKSIIYKFIDTDLYEKYKAILHVNANNKQTGGKYDKLVHFLTSVPNLDKYSVKNDRIVCNKYSKDVCNANPHCHWTHSGCLFAMTKEMAISFINKISEELAQNELKAFELLQYEGYYVSDIVDTTKFAEREEQKIIRSTSETIKKVLIDYLGSETSIKIGRFEDSKNDINYQQLNIENPLYEFNFYYIQRVMDNNLSIFRAFVNGFYWIKNKYNDIEERNLGYYNSLQTDLGNYFRSKTIDWLNDNNDIVNSIVFKYFNIKSSSKNPIEDFVIKIGKFINNVTNCIVELHVLSKINNVPIVVYNDKSIPIFIFNDGLVYEHKHMAEIPFEYHKLIHPEMVKFKDNSVKNDANKIINLKFSYATGSKIPSHIDTIYFK